MQEFSSVCIPFVKPPAHLLTNEGRHPMSHKDATLFRRAAARINYVAFDRPDLSFASRVAAGNMSNPLEGDGMLVKRVIRYFKGRPRVAILYCFQGAEPDIVVLTDSDWAGDELTRRITSERCSSELNSHHYVVVQTPGTNCFVVVRGGAQRMPQGSHRRTERPEARQRLWGRPQPRAQDRCVRRTRCHHEARSWQDSPPARKAILVARNRGSWRTGDHQNPKV